MVVGICGSFLPVSVLRCRYAVPLHVHSFFWASLWEELPKTWTFYNIPCLRGTWELSWGLWKKCLRCISKILDTYINETETFAILSALCNQTCRSRHHFCYPSKKHWGPKAFRKQQEEALLKMQAPCTLLGCSLGTAASKGCLLSFLLPGRSWHFFSGDEGTEAEREAAEEAAGERQLGTTSDKIWRANDWCVLFFLRREEAQEGEEKEKRHGPSLPVLLQHSLRGLCMCI